MPSIDQYIATTTDWRKVIRQNSRRTYLVIFSFFAIYALIGIIVDLYLFSFLRPFATIPELFVGLITFQTFPIATAIMLGIAAISLFVSYTLYDRLMLMGTDYHEVTPSSARTESERRLYNVIEEMKIAAGLRFMPKVYIINADYMNAFASGYSEKSAMVAITRGLMDKLNRDELQAVMAHELSHIRHLDIKLTLTASLLSNMSLMVLDMFFYRALYTQHNSSNSQSRNKLGIIIVLLRYLLPIVSMLLLFYLSRTRELMADAGCVELMRANEPLASALIKIANDHKDNKERYNQAYQQTPHENVRREAYIYDPTQAGFSLPMAVSDLFSTHPSLKVRLEALGFKLRNTK